MGDLGKTIDATAIEKLPKLQLTSKFGHIGPKASVRCWRFIFKVLFTIPSFRETYVLKSDEIFDTISLNEDQTKNCLLQMAKLGAGLWSGDYSVKEAEVWWTFIKYKAWHL